MDFLKPKYIIGIEYEKNVRKKIVIVKIRDVIKYLMTHDFIIGPRKTTIHLGPERIFSLQKKRR